VRAATAAVLLLAVAGCAKASDEQGGPPVVRIGGVIEVSFDTTQQTVQDAVAQRCVLRAVETPLTLGLTRHWYRDPGGDAREALVKCAQKEPRVLSVALPL